MVAEQFLDFFHMEVELDNKPQDVQKYNLMTMIQEVLRQYGYGMSRKKSKDPSQKHTKMFT